MGAEIGCKLMAEKTLGVDYEVTFTPDLQVLIMETNVTDSTVWEIFDVYDVDIEPSVVDVLAITENITAQGSGLKGNVVC